jgi:hypothetical protein
MSLRPLPNQDGQKDLSVTLPHGLLEYEDTNTKCRLYWCLKKCIDWRYSQSYRYFRPSFVNYCPSNLLSGSPPPVCGWAGVSGCWVVLETIFCRSLTLCFLPDSESTKLLHHPEQNPRREGGLRQTNTCRKVPLKVNFFCFLSVYSCYALPTRPLPLQTTPYDDTSVHR